MTYTNFTITKETSKATLFLFGTNEQWVPDSCFTKKGDTIEVSDWFAKKEMWNLSDFLVKEETKLPAYLVGVPVDIHDHFRICYADGYTQIITGDACTGDEVAFAEAIYKGRYPKSTFSHYEVLTGKIIKDSYGEAKQQHTFTIELSGIKGGKKLIKGRNLYKIITLAKPRPIEERQAALDEKHTRGDEARSASSARKARKESKKYEDLFEDVDIDYSEY